MNPLTLPFASTPSLELVRAVDETQVLEVRSIGHFFAEASALGWAPGFWPRVVSLLGEAFTAKECERSNAGVFEGVLYESPSGRTLTVVND